MPVLILPGVTIEVRAEALIVPGRISVGTLGVVGTASRGPLNTPVALGSAAEARAVFGAYDAWAPPPESPLTLVRSLELAFDHGAGRVIALRVSAEDKPDGDPDVKAAATAALVLKAGGAPALTVRADSPGTWGNNIVVEVAQAEPADQCVVTDPETAVTAAATVELANRIGVLPGDRRTRVKVRKPGAAAEDYTVVVSDPTDPKEVRLDTNGTLTFAAAGRPAPGDAVLATYVVGNGSGTLRRVRVRHGDTSESYLTTGAAHLCGLLANSALLPGSKATVTKDDVPLDPAAGRPAGGTDGAQASDADYTAALRQLLDQDAHIIVAAGRPQAFAAQLAAHCELASSDAWQRERIAVTGTEPVAAGSAAERADPALDISALLGHRADSDRLVLVGPGLRMPDPAGAPDAPPVVLPAAYTAAAFAGLLSSFDPQVSPTNKPLAVSGLEVDFTRAQLQDLVAARVTVLERRQGFLVVRGVTTSTNTAFQQITTRRITDYARMGVRSAAQPYIGLLNNPRVRTALRATVNSFLTDMLAAEMLTSYQVDVGATRDEEIRGIVRVTLTLLPTFSIEYVTVTIFLQ